VVLSQCENIVEFINKNDFSWKAAPNKFSEMPTQSVKKMMGFVRNPKLDEIRNFVQKTSESYYSNKDLSALPANFDARTQWGTCIGGVLYQGQCGSCWAFGATESFTDRLCIASAGKSNFSLSVEQMVSCNLGGIEGCSGGEPISAFIYTAEWGLPKDSCFPYTAGSGTAPPCASSCVNGDPFTLYYNYLSSIHWHLRVDWIQEAIFTNGPVEACFTVYEDFLEYESGVYVYKTGDELGGHCIKLVGWGVENNLEYWIAQNSWGTSWGESGFFKIQKGVDMCGIEGEVFSALPVV